MLNDSNQELPQIRIAKKPDAIRIAEVLTSALAKKQARNDGSWGEGSFTESEVLDLLDRGTVFVLEINDTIFGCAQVTNLDIDHLWPNNKPSCYVHRLATSAQVSGMNYGSFLLRACCEYAKSKGIKVIRLDCDEDNEKLCAYYKNQGFKQVSSKPKNNGKIAALFEKEI